jgi:hypothetical protein
LEDFLEDIGDSNRKTIRHVGYLVPLNPTDEKTEGMLHRMSKFAHLKTLTFEVDNKNSTYHQNAIEESFNRAQNLLRLWNRLESVIITSTTLRTRINDEYPRELILNSRELKLHKFTGELTTTGSVVKRDIKGSMRVCISARQTFLQKSTWLRCVRFASISRTVFIERAPESEVESEESAP